MGLGEKKKADACTRASLFCILPYAIQIIQQSIALLKDYSAAGKNVLGLITRPKCCPRCGKEHAFHSHGSYSRFVNNLEVWIVRLRCRYCVLDVSVLPDFAMPYRNRSVEVVDQYFRASNQERSQTGGQDTLRHYWSAWVRVYKRVLRMAGVAADHARSAWVRLTAHFRGASAAQRRMVGEYKQALLKRYIVHAAPKSARV